MSAMPTRPAATSLEAALERVGDRWSFLVVEALMDGSRRFNELAEAVPGIAPNILADRLRRLERDGVIVGRPYQERPPRLEYALTADGMDLAGALRLLADWGSRHMGGGEPLRHSLCGTALEARWYCPTCGRSIDHATADDVRRL